MAAEQGGCVEKSNFSHLFASLLRRSSLAQLGSGFCRRSRLSPLRGTLSVALEEFVLELADNLCLPSQGIRIDRAGAMLHCIVRVVERSWCLIELLRHSRRVGVYR